MRHLINILTFGFILFAAGCAREQKIFIHEAQYVVPPPEKESELPEIPYEEGSENCGCDSETEGFPLLVTMENPANALYNEYGDLELREDLIILQGRCEGGMLRIEYENVELGLEEELLSCEELKKVLSEKGYENSFTIVFHETW